MPLLAGAARTFTDSPSAPGRRTCSWPARAAHVELRLREAERQGLAMAHWLEARPEVLRVLHPALPGRPGHAIWRRDFLGSSGLFSVDAEAGRRAAVAPWWTGSSSSAWAIPGAATRASSSPSTAGLPQRDAWPPGGPALRLLDRPRGRRRPQGRPRRRLRPAAGRALSGGLRPGLTGPRSIPRRCGAAPSSRCGRAAP